MRKGKIPLLFLTQIGREGALCWNVAVLPLQVCLLLEGLQPGAGSCSPLLSAVGMEMVSHTAASLPSGCVACNQCLGHKPNSFFGFVRALVRPVFCAVLCQALAEAILQTRQTSQDLPPAPSSLTSRAPLEAPAATVWLGGLPHLATSQSRSMCIIARGPRHH